MSEPEAYRFCRKGPFYVYAIKNNVTDKIYVGRTCNPERRWQTHMYDLRARRHNVSDMTIDYHKYGKESFSFEVVGAYKTEDMAKTMETFYMKVLRSQNPAYGYNHLDRNGTSDIAILDRWRTRHCEQVDSYRTQQWQFHRIYVLPKKYTHASYWLGRSLEAISRKWKHVRRKGVATS